MSRAQRGTHLLGLVDSDSEDGLSGPTSTRFGSSKAATKTKQISTITKPTKSILKQQPVPPSSATKPTAASTAKQATTKPTTTTTTRTKQQQSKASGAGAGTMAPAKRKTAVASTPSVANKRTAAAATVAASASKVTKASAQKPKRLTAVQKAALARAALQESSGNVVAATPSTVGKATRASGRTKRGAAAAVAAMAPVEEETETTTGPNETMMEEDTTMHDVTAVTVEVEEAPKETTTTRATRGRPRRADAAGAVAETPMSTATTTRGGRGRKKKVEEPVVEEEETTQQDEVTEEITHEETQLEEEEEESLPIPGAWRSGPSVPASTSRKSSSLGLGFKTHTANSDEVELRRKLGEMTQKYEALELKYRDLREVAVKEAERNFDRLRKQSEERTAASDQLIAALKSELSSHKEAARENARVQKQLEASESQLFTLNAKVAELTSSLTKSKTEINALNIKLTASRQAEAAAVAKIGQPQMPGSAIKNKQNGNRVNTEAIAQATQQAQLKEDLYSDLTGLIVRGVKRDQQSGEDVYDCIQTGKNGTLHFKLAHISANTAHVDADETTQIFDEDQFHYMPQLDTNRDRALIDLLPDYLVEEITFPRQHAAKFYSRVNKALTETVQQA
ncbi:putative MAM1 protein [Sordaria brevicollis]|uniref:MAM1 protein n=1 Tax=Sordaria brevicollis TaxID=83679 RepID=A0AAE0UCC3_SORBR|nr:putative MAM1 protein [Sordaria brevicollis]